MFEEPPYQNPHPDDFVAAEPIGIAGAGRIGQALAGLLSRAGQPVVAVSSRSAEQAARAAKFAGPGVQPVVFEELPRHAGRIIIAVPDGAIAAVACRLAEGGLRGGIVLHTCGAMGMEPLLPLADRSTACGTLHPLQTVATPEHGLTALRNIYYAIDGHPAALRWAEQIAGALAGQALRISAGKRAVYHAAAVMAGNYLIGLVDAAAILVNAAGVERERALAALAPLMQTSLANALALGPEQALTGPIQRGDAETVRRHIEALAAAPETVRGLYRAAGLHTLDLARRRGLPEPDARMLEELLRESENRDA